MSAADWIKLDLHIHTLDDQKDALDYSAHQLLERAQRCGIEVLAITLHDFVFDRKEVFAEAAAMGILLIPAAEMRLHGADIVVLNVTPEEAAGLKDFDDMRRLRAHRGDSIFTFAPHPFYIMGGSIGGKRLVENLDCFDAIEICHFHKGWFDRNRPAKKLAAQRGKPLLATSDAHQLSAFGSHYTSIPRPTPLTAESVFAALRSGAGKLTSPPCSFADLCSTLYFLFVVHPIRQRQRGTGHAGGNATLESGPRT
ncbi:MAG TPA: PHP domain-containing protein [Chthoniobacterales bacterium]|nr:PHP domain-containing protein [Chthoniobacterales bacterium]